MNAEIRNEYGFPVVDRFEAAKQYAAQAKERNKLPCNCAICREREMLPAVINITNNWSKQ